MSALDVENVLLGHPGVAECAVVGLADPDWGQRIVAAVVPVEPDLDTDALREWCRGHLSPFKIPKSIQLVDALPRNAMGKVVKATVAAQLES